MGGMQALQWTASYPQMMEKAIIIASTMTHSPMQIAFNNNTKNTLKYHINQSYRCRIQSGKHFYNFKQSKKYII